MDDKTEHYFSKTPNTPYRPQEITVNLAGKNRQIVTAPGIFSPDALDRGTQVLLTEIPVAAAGNILDIGCGWGAISLHSALENDKSMIYAVDVSERALELTRLNAQRLGLRNIFICSPEEVPKDLLFQEIRSNPPIRVGKAELHSILKQWLPRLAPQGEAFLVVAKKLGADSLRNWIALNWPEYEVSRFARNKGFHVIRIHNKVE